jgi:aminoglycoside 3-N-acetyltransferase
MNSSFTILTQEDIVKGLQEVGIVRGMHLIVHTSLKSFGFVIGGPETIIRALLDCVGPEGTLMMPTQTWKNLDPTIGVHWEVPEVHWQLIRDQWPAYDKTVTPAIGMGCVAEMLRTWPGAQRSDHPARSFAAVGHYAKHLTENHDLCNIFGEGSPLDKLYQLGGHILLLGVGYDKNTSIHLAETKASYPGKKNTKESSAILVDENREWVTYETLDVDDSDFVALGKSYEAEHTPAKTIIGQATVRLINQPHFVDYSIKWFETNRI